MAWYDRYSGLGESEYFYYGDRYPQYHLPAPVTFRQAPFYDDEIYYRRNFRDQHWDHGHGGVVNIEQVLPRRKDPYPLHHPHPSSSSGPWWHYRDYAHGGYPVYVVPAEAKPVESTVELYAPQLCCDSCERRVVECLEDLHGVHKVIADQWEKKVTVKGHNLKADHVLRRLQRVSHMKRSVLWKDR